MILNFLVIVSQSARFLLSAAANCRLRKETEKGSRAAPFCSYLFAISRIAAYRSSGSTSSE